MSAHEPDSLAAARADVERTREELGNTVEALAYKADVKARAHDKVDEVKAQAAHKVDEVKAQAAHKVDEVKAKAADSAEHARATAQETAVQAQTRVRQVPTAALAGAAAGLLVLAVVLWRRGSR
jgi:ElaB/YqjD/DUF883 family membrane-anchored ribosome-binding protein